MPTKTSMASLMRSVEFHPEVAASLSRLFRSVS